MENSRKIVSKADPNVILRVVPGHFVTPNTHVNYYMDMTAIKSRISEAHAAAKLLSTYHYYSTTVDTIVCLEGTEVIGAYLAEELTKAGVISKNAHKSIYVVTPEYTPSGQMIFRGEPAGWIRDKNVLLLLAAATTGNTVSRALESLLYYGATISGISAIFSIASKIGGLPVHSIFTQADLPDYASHAHEDCPLCKGHITIDGICNGYGMSSLT